MDNINKKSTPDQMRILLKRIRAGSNGKWQTELQESPQKNLDMCDMLKITRKLNENAENKAVNKETVYDQSREEQKFLDNFRDLNVNVRFIDLEVYENFVFWGGTIDGIIQFSYAVTPNESTSQKEINYLEDFSPDNPKNTEIVKRIESYYDTFYKYWQNNLIQN